MEEKGATIKHKKVKGRVKVLKATLYNSHMIYIRMIGKDYFEYLLEFNGEIYGSYIIMAPSEGKKKLNKMEISQCASLIYAGAEATLDSLLGRDKVKEAEQKYIDMGKKYVDTVDKELKKSKERFEKGTN